MRLRILSDLHHETFGGERPIPAADADVVVLAGDIHTQTNGLEWAARRFPNMLIVYVAGNHEYYHAHLQELEAQLRADAQRLGIHFLEQDAVIIDGVRFLGTTLWTDFDLYGPQAAVAAAHMAIQVMPDFRIIETDNGDYTPQMSVVCHQQSRNWLQMQLNTPFAGKTVVVTHHAPSALSVPEQFQGDTLSPAFSSNLDALVEQADLWIHGHTHTCFDYRVGRSRVVANPGGYPNENAAFDAALVIQI
jgi:predicted phosphodiesterase